jgi:hypothetical protein
VAEELEHPVGVAGPPVVLVAVEDERGVGRAPMRRISSAKRPVVEVVAAQRVVEVARPVHLDRARHVAGGVEQRVLVALH